MTTAPPPARPFTIVEILVVIGTLVIIMSLLLPALSRSQNKAHKARWEGHMRDQRATDKVVLQYMLLDDTTSSTLLNTAQGQGIPSYDRTDYNATLQGSWHWEDGRWLGKKALRLAGSGDFLTTANPLVIADPETQAFTIIAWIRPIVTRQQTIFSNQRAGQTGITLELDSKNQLTTRTADRTYSATQNSLTAPKDIWSMIAMVQHPDTGVTMYCYREDGHQAVEFILDKPLPTLTPDAQFTTTIGAQSDDNGRAIHGFCGDLGDLTIYRRPLSAEDIQQAFSNTRP